MRHVETQADNGVSSLEIVADAAEGSIVLICGSSSATTGMKGVDDGCAGKIVVLFVLTEEAAVRFFGSLGSLVFSKVI